MFLFSHKERRHGVLLDQPLDDPPCCRRCDGACCRAFVSIVLSWDEFRRLERLGAQRLILPLFGPPLLVIDDGCEFLDHGQCMIYPERPDICRRFTCTTDPRVTAPFTAAPEPFFPGI